MKLLKIAIFAQQDSATITEHLAPLLRERGHTVDIVDLSIIPREGFIDQPEIQALVEYDLAYYRSGLQPGIDSSRVLELEQLLKTHSVKTVNLHYTKHPLAHSKIYETQQADKFKLAIPQSIYDHRGVDFATASESLGVPFVSKTTYGSGGDGVHLVHNDQEFAAIQATYPNSELFYQSFIPHDFEYRIYIINGTPVCFWRKTPPEDDFRSNEAKGGGMLLSDPQHIAELTRLAAVSHEAFDFEIFVADFMLDKNTNTFYFTEINLNPGWGPPDLAAAGVDVIALTADYFQEICS
jgi:glutathione synthase/RimK-type ligase-like ATP-grasp enzyme